MTDRQNDEPGFWIMNLNTGADMIDHRGEKVLYTAEIALAIIQKMAFYAMRRAET